MFKIFVEIFRRQTSTILLWSE